MEKTVYFRAFEEEDAEAIYQWMNDDELKKMSVGLNRKICKEEALEWVRARMHHDPYQVWWAICAKDTDNIIGYTFLTHIHYINSSAELGGLMIDKHYQDGFAWIESHQFVFNYVFESLGLNRIYGESLVGHKQSNLMEDVMFFTREGIKRQSVFKNGKFYDVSFVGLLRDEYFAHKNAGEYETKAIIKRVAEVYKQKKVK